MKALIDAIILIHFQDINIFTKNTGYSKSYIRKIRYGSFKPSNGLLKKIDVFYKLPIHFVKPLLEQNCSIDIYIKLILEYYKSQHLFPDLVCFWTNYDIKTISNIYSCEAKNLFKIFDITRNSCCLNWNKFSSLTNFDIKIYNNIAKGNRSIINQNYLDRLSISLKIDKKIIYKCYLDSFSLSNNELILQLLEYFKKNKLFGFSKSEDYRKGYILKLLHNIKGIDTIELSKSLNISSTYVKQLERSKEIQDNMFYKFMKFYGISYENDIQLIISSSSKMELLYNILNIYRNQKEKLPIINTTIKEYQYFDYNSNNYKDEYTNALNGDIGARQNIYKFYNNKIKLYSEMLIKKFNTSFSQLGLCPSLYIDNDDIKQDMYLFVWEKINNYFDKSYKTDLVAYLNQALERYVAIKILMINDFIDHELCYIDECKENLNTSYDELAIIYENKEKIADIKKFFSSNKLYKKYVKMIELLEQKYDNCKIAEALNISHHNVLVSKSCFRKQLKKHFKY